MKNAIAFLVLACIVALGFFSFAYELGLSEKGFSADTPESRRQAAWIFIGFTVLGGIVWWLDRRRRSDE